MPEDSALARAKAGARALVALAIEHLGASKEDLARPWVKRLCVFNGIMHLLQAVQMVASSVYLYICMIFRTIKSWDSNE